LAVYRQIQITYWQDKFVLKLTPEEKFFYIYLLTNSKTKQCGIYELPIQIICLETGYNRETVVKLIQRFIEHDKIKYDWENEEVFLLNWLKHNPFGGNQNIEKCIKKELLDVHNPSMIPLTSPLQALIKGSDNKNKNKNKNKNNNNNNRFAPPSLEEVANYILENKYSVDANSFIDFYSSKGWMVGKNKMKDWRAAVRTWNKRGDNGTDKKQAPRGSFDVDKYAAEREASKPKGHTELVPDTIPKRIQ